MRIESSLCMSVGLKVMPAVGSTPEKRPTNSLPVIFIPDDDRVCVWCFSPWIGKRKGKNQKWTVWYNMYIMNGDHLGRQLKLQIVNQP